MTDRYPTTIHVDAAMVAKIDQPIDGAIISRRPGGGNTTQAYLKGDIIADQLNSVFGPLGWSKQSRIHTVDDWDEEKTVTRNNQSTKVNMHMVQVISDVTLTIKKVTPDGADTVFVEQGIGYGEIESGKSRKEAFGMAVKGASTDGLKRCASLIGKAFGMMMASSGTQDDIEYAHNGKAQDARKAREMRSGRASRNDDRSGRGDRDDRNDRHDNRSETRGDRGDDRGQRSSSGRDEGQRTREVPSRDAAPRGDERREAPPRDTQRAATGNTGTAQERAAAGGNGAAKSKAGERRKPLTNYPLDSVPVSLDDQTDFGATLAMRVKEMRQQADREGLVKQHVNTIRNLDGPIRKRLRDLLTEAGVDVDRVTS